MVNIVAHCTQNVVLIIAPPGMGKSRASEEMHTQLVLRMSSHIIIYVKLSQTISFWTKCSDNPLVKDFLRECTDEDKLNQYPEREMLFVIDGFDEVCPNFRSKVVTLIKELLVKSKVLITSRPQEKDKIIERLKGVADIINFEIEPFSMYQMVVMLLTRLNLEAKRLVQI